MSVTTLRRRDFSHVRFYGRYLRIPSIDPSTREGGVKTNMKVLRTSLISSKGVYIYLLTLI